MLLNYFNKIKYLNIYDCLKNQLKTRLETSRLFFNQNWHLLLIKTVTF